MANKRSIALNTGKRRCLCAYTARACVAARVAESWEGVANPKRVLGWTTTPALATPVTNSSGLGIVWVQVQDGYEAMQAA